jgi:ABC-2 type transport system permease protein
MNQKSLSLQLNAILTIAARDFTKLLRDRPRILISFIFPIIFIGVLGGSFQASIGNKLGFNLQEFIFIGVFISRYTIIIGKIFGETLVSFVQVIGILLFGLIIGVPISWIQLLFILPAGLIASLFGGAFGTLVLANLGNQRSANQIFPFLIFPQIFLSGIFSPIDNLPPPLFIFSRIVPLTYAVDFVRGVFFIGRPEQKLVTIFPIHIDLLIITVYFTVMLVTGTWLFVKNERNR